jgi:rsbT co-antagonist protein RsbR
MNQKIEVAGLDIEWREDEGLCLWAGSPVMTAWTESTMAGFLATIQRMVGTERFQLGMHQGGRDSIDGDWAVISAAPTFQEGFVALSKIAARGPLLPRAPFGCQEGFVALSKIAAAAGWGRWELVSSDKQAHEARVRVYNNWESIAQRALGVSWGASFVAGKLAAYFQRYFGVNTCWADQTAYLTKGDAWDEFIIRPSTSSVEQRIEELYRTESATKADLALALEHVQREVEERVKTEQELRDKLELIARQDEAIKALSTPIIEIWEGVLTLPLFGVMDSQRATETMERLLQAIVEKGATHSIIDLTGVELVDTSTADHLGKLVKAAALIGTQCIITGIRPAVAQTMVQIGIDLSTIVTLSTLREALRYCMRPTTKLSKRP